MALYFRQVNSKHDCLYMILRTKGMNHVCIKDSEEKLRRLTDSRSTKIITFFPSSCFKMLRNTTLNEPDKTPLCATFHAETFFFLLVTRRERK